MRVTDTHIYFWDTFLSNFYACEFTVDGQKYFNSEQFFMAEKARTFKDEKTLKEILEEKAPLKCKKLGRKIKGFDNELWDSLRVAAMEKACYAKFSQNCELRNKLLFTENKTLVEASPYDKIWGIGLHWKDDRVLDREEWKGRNLLGKALMKVRAQLREELISFGDYVLIEQHRYNAENEMYLHKVIGELRSNTYVDVPVVGAIKEVIHSEMEDVVACICCSVDEREVLRYRLKDVKKVSIPDKRK